MKLVVFIPCLVSSPERLDYLRDLIWCINQQTVHADEYILCVSGDCRILTNRIRVINYDGELSQFLQLKYAYEDWRKSVTTLDDYWVTFSDGDDLWKTQHIEQIRYYMNNDVVDGFAPTQRLRYTTEIEKSDVGPRSSAVEYWMMTMKAKILEHFFKSVNLLLLKHVYADRAFVYWVIKNYKMALIPEEEPTYIYRIHDDSTTSTKHKSEYKLSAIDIHLFCHTTTGEHAKYFNRLSWADKKQCQKDFNIQRKIYGEDMIPDLNLIDLCRNIEKAI
jgi:hypothetical protein